MHHLLMKIFRHCYKRMHKGQASDDSHGQKAVCNSRVNINHVVAASISDDHSNIVTGSVF